jgi:nucleotide-binding universal stress UspA family protein
MGFWMYRRILLAADASREGLIALREGVLLASTCAAAVHLLVIEVETPGLRLANGIYPIAPDGTGKELLALGLSRLSSLGVAATGETAAGEPALLIGKVARGFGADLIVVGHRRQSRLDRWWSGSSGAYLVDNVNCSVLIARNLISDQEFEARLHAVIPAT